MIFISGPHAAGKTRCMEYLSENGYAIFDTGPTIRAIHQSQAPHIDIAEWVANGEREFGSNFSNDLITHALAQKIKELPSANHQIIIAGYRTLDGILHIHNHLSSAPHLKPVILYLTAEEALLWERWRDREESTGHSVTREEFQAKRERERPLLFEIEKVATGIIYNEGSMEDLYRKVQAFIDAQDIFMHDQGQAAAFLNNMKPQYLYEQ